jgi:hypothetical protein
LALTPCEVVPHCKSELHCVSWFLRSPVEEQRDRHHGVDQEAAVAGDVVWTALADGRTTAGDTRREKRRRRARIADSPPTVIAAAIISPSGLK